RAKNPLWTNCAIGTEDFSSCFLAGGILPPQFHHSKRFAGLPDAREVAVDYIERIFGVSPDANSGSLEVFFLTFCLVSVLAFLAGRIASLKRKRRYKPVLTS